jgi:hypothetical protein
MMPFLKKELYEAIQLALIVLPVYNFIYNTPLCQIIDRFDFFEYIHILLCILTYGKYKYITTFMKSKKKPEQPINWDGWTSIKTTFFWTPTKLQIQEDGPAQYTGVFTQFSPKAAAIV